MEIIFALQGCYKVYVESMSVKFLHSLTGACHPLHQEYDLHKNMTCLRAPGGISEM